MNSPQSNGRRRSARLAFDEGDNDAPSKKTKMEEITHRSEKRSDARANGEAIKNRKKKYDDGDGDFQFVRKGTRKTQAKPIVVPEPVQEERETTPPQPKPKVKKMLPVTPTLAEKRPKRRSARLSGDKDQVQAAKVPEKPKQLHAPPSQAPVKPREPSPQSSKAPIKQRQHSPESRKAPAKQREHLPQPVNKPARQKENPPELKRPPVKPKESSPQPIEAPAELKQPSPQPQKTVPQPDRDGSPALLNADSPLRIAKRQDATKISLPFADTPINKRNKELRKSHRRSSTGIRGRRASSLIESGSSNAMPHAEVETSEFYKHISQDLLEPRRMKQLLTWCGTRALPNKPTGAVESSSAIMAARVIQEELLKDFSNRPELSDWFNREESAPTVLVKKPNPRNIQNAAKLKELEQEIEKLQLEKRNWDSLLESSSTIPPDFLPHPPSPPRSHKKSIPPSLSTHPQNSNSLPTIDPTLLSPSQSALLSSLQDPPSATNPSSIEARLQSLTSSLEFKIDRFATGIHRLENLKRRGDEAADRVLGEAAQRLEDRDREAKGRVGMGGVDLRDVLRGLSRVLEGE
ncbi:MAG: hypothetical protein M1820_005043 [Bogoriella megaspora]|nr:MAG: hypothetical protein M1820_005043 [Bogoriella megaspora]